MRSGGDDPIRAAIARHEAAKQAVPLVTTAALALCEGGDMEDAALALVEEEGLEWPVAKRLVVAWRAHIEAMVEAMETCIRKPEDVSPCWLAALRRRGLVDEELLKRLPDAPKDSPEDPEPGKGS
jgi:hypothetical protein